MDRRPEDQLVLAHIPSKHQLIQETILLSVEMETRYPELYKFLDETPLLLANMHQAEIGIADFEKYLQTLKVQVLNHMDNRK